MKTLTQLAQELQRLGGNPNALAELDREIAGKYAFLSEKMKDIQVKKAVFWNMKFAGEKTLSDTYIETKWLQEDDGKDDLKLKYELKGLERLTMAIKNSIVVASIESRNNA